MTVPLRSPQTPDEAPLERSRDQGIPRSYLRDPDGKLRRDLNPKELHLALKQSGTNLWVDIDSTNRHQLAVLEKIFNFHPLSIEDSVNPSSRVKVEEFPDYLFVVVRVVRFCDTTPDPYDLETFNLNLFIGRNFLVTVHGESSPSVGAVENLLIRNPDMLDRGPARLGHMILDTAIDAHFPVVDQLDDFIDGLEERVFGSFDEGVLHEIFTVKRTVIALRRYLSPQREVFNILTNRPTQFVPPETQVYFRDVYDHMLRINDSLDNYRELLSSTLDSYLTQVSNRLGMVTKGLSVVATMSVPFVVVAGIYGMNFQNIPLANNPNGFWIMVVVQLAIGLGLVAFLKWRRWL
jgi:magnesium transporter